MKIKGLYQKRGWFYYQPQMVDGNRPQAVALGTQDEAEAVDKAFELHSRKALNTQSRDRMDYLLDRYLAAQLAARIHTLKTSAITRTTLGALCKLWENPQVRAIDRRKVEAWRSDLQNRKGLAGEKMSEASISSYLLRLKGFLTWLVDERHLREHPMKGIVLPRVKKTRRDRFCSVEEREKLLVDPPSDEIDFILHFGFFAGLRFGEMVAMQDTWLVPKGESWVLCVQETDKWKPKDKEARTIEVHPRLAAFIKDYGIRKGYMLAPKKKLWRDPPAYRFNPKKSFATYVKERGCEWVTYHTLRHTFASHAAMKGLPLIEIAYLLGDSLRVTEDTYAGFLPDSGSRLAEI